MFEAEGSSPVKRESVDAGELRRAFIHGKRARRSVGADCPPPEKIWEAVRGESTPAEVEALLEHTLRCEACAQDWRLARAVSVEADSEGAESRLGVSRPWWSRAPVWLATAAAIVLAVVGIQQVVERSGPAPAFRETGSDTPSIQTLIPEESSLPRDRFLLKWSPGPEGSLYTVRVMTEDLRPVATVRNLETSEYQVPAKNLERLSAGARLFWEVTMDRPDGSRLNSPVFAIRLQP